MDTIRITEDSLKAWHQKNIEHIEEHGHKVTSESFKVDNWQISGHISAEGALSDGFYVHQGKRGYGFWFPRFSE